MGLDPSAPLAARSALKSRRMARAFTLYRTIGKTPRNGHCARRHVSERNRRTAAALSAEIDRSLQTRRKFAIVPLGLSTV